MKKLIFGIFFIMLVSSCGLFKKVFRAKQVQSSEVSITTKTDSSVVVIDKSKITVNEKIDTLISTKEVKIREQVSFNPDSLLKGISAIKNDLLDVVLKYDPLTKLLTADATIKPQNIPVKFDRTTTTDKDVSQKSNVKKSGSQSTKSKNKNSTVQKEPAKMGIWLIAVLVGLIIVVGSIWYWTKSKAKLL